MNDVDTLQQVLDIVASVLFVAGSFLVMVAGIGILRFPDLLARMHAATKPQVLGLSMLMTGLALEIHTGSAVWTLVLVVLFQLMTAPVSAHMVGRAGYRTGRIDRENLVVDDLTTDLELIREVREQRLAEVRQRIREAEQTDAGAGAGGSVEASAARDDAGTSER